MAQHAPLLRPTFQELLTAVVETDEPNASSPRHPGRLISHAQFLMLVASTRTHTRNLQHFYHGVSTVPPRRVDSRAPVTGSESTGGPLLTACSLVNVPPGATPHEPKKRVRNKSERRREQCRVNQARYRRKKIAQNAALRTAVEGLRGEISELMVHRQRLCDPRAITTRPTPTQTLVRLFDLLRCGLASAREGELPSRAQQLEFITSVVDEHVRVGEMRGHQALLDQIERFSTYFGDLLVVLRRVQEVHADRGTNTLHQSIRLELTITTDTIQHVFPQLLLPYDRVLLLKMVGQRLVCDGQCLTVFDAVGHIIDMSWTINFASALNRILSIKETAEVLEVARIKRDAFLQVPMPAYTNRRPTNFSRGRHWYLSGSHFGTHFGL